MSEATDALEQAQHAANKDHAPAPSKAPTKLIGLTMALMGVLIAFCAAMVGGQNGDLTRAMIEQTEANADATAASIKYRLVMLRLEQMRSTTATTSSTASDDATLRRYLRLYLDYAKERELSKTWADSYSPLVQAHFDGGDGFSNAQLLAEVGIVLASVAVLLGMRGPWYISLILAVLCITQLVRIYVRTNHSVASAQANVQRVQEGYSNLRKAHAAANGDEFTVDTLDPGGRIRMSLDDNTATH